MNVSLIPRSTTECMIFAFPEVDRMYMGVEEFHDEKAQDQLVRMPEIELFYPGHDLALVLAIAKEMKSYDQKPKVYFSDYESVIDVTVAFDFEVREYEFLADIISPHQMNLFRKQSGDKRKLVHMTGEMDFDRRSVRTFRDEFKAKKEFVVNISQENPDNKDKPVILWTARLTDPDFIDGEYLLF